MRPTGLCAVHLPRAVAAKAIVGGTSGVWENVTPAFLDLSATGGAPRNTGTDNYGLQDVWFDPFDPSIAYGFTCYQGMLRSTDYGRSNWVKASIDGGLLDYGKNWGGDVHRLGGPFYMTSGNNAQLSPEAKTRVLRSPDRGESWFPSSTLTNDPYTVSTSPTDRHHAVTTFHDAQTMWETTDSYRWVNAGTVTDGTNTLSQSGYPWMYSDTQVLAMSQAGSISTESGLFLGTKSAGAWTWQRVHATANHAHGTWQPYHDADNGFIYVPYDAGILRAATSDLTTWTQVNNIETMALAATATTIYAMYSFPINTGTQDPKIRTSLRSSGTSWNNVTTPSGMVNGAKRLATSTDGQKWCVLMGGWHAGLWWMLE